MFDRQSNPCPVDNESRTAIPSSVDVEGPGKIRFGIVPSSFGKNLWVNGVDLLGERLKENIRLDRGLLEVVEGRNAIQRVLIPLLRRGMYPYPP